MTLEHRQNILTRGLPKTGQIISYAAGDDGNYEAGWWLGRLNANNRTRWIAKTIAGGAIVLDRATGLIWAADGNAAGCNNGNMLTWPNAIIYCNLLNFAGFTDWRLPNVRELVSIIAYNLSGPSIEQPPFLNTDIEYYWSSTSYFSTSTAAWIIDFFDGISYLFPKTQGTFLRAVRRGI